MQVEILSVLSPLGIRTDRAAAPTAAGFAVVPVGAMGRWTMTESKTSLRPSLFPGKKTGRCIAERCRAYVTG